MITSKRIKLRKRSLADAVDNYAWMTDPELTQLDAAPLLRVSFAQYLTIYQEELSYPSAKRCAFAVETTEEKHVGNCSYYDINQKKKEAQLGIMIGNRDYWDKGYGAEAVTTLLDHIFRNTDLNRVYLKTLVSNIRAQRCFQKCGFTFCGHLDKDGYRFALMEVHRKRWREDDS
ncbi:MAG: GNAT family N-acetyltransferase [Dehalococcoidales bacterium]|nr:GNAT family N-acetyltransferase [Dehalococcoidales bacterium]